jgi:hypothetical protein
MNSALRIEDRAICYTTSRGRWRHHLACSHGHAGHAGGGDGGGKPWTLALALMPNGPVVSAAGLIRDRKESRSRPRPGFWLIVLWDRCHRLPNVVDQPKNLAVIAKRVKIAGISSDLNNGPCHAISLGPEVRPSISTLPRNYSARKRFFQPARSSRGGPR